MKRRDSLTSPNKISTVQVLIEKILLSKYKLEPYFWNKSKCKKFNNEIYNLNKRLYQCLMVPYNKYGDEILWTAVCSFSNVQMSKLAEAAKYNQKPAIIATISAYCNKEVERAERLQRPKDTSDPEPLRFDPGKDLRSKKPKTNKPSLWEFLNG